MFCLFLRDFEQTQSVSFNERQTLTNFEGEGEFLKSSRFFWDHLTAFDQPPATEFCTNITINSRINRA